MVNEARAAHVVSVVDDDESVRESLQPFLETVGFSVRAFSSAEDFLASDALLQSDCLVLDVRMTGMSGIELQQELTARGLAIPIVFITAHGDAELRSRVLERGAVDCLGKPFGDDALLQAVHTAIGTSKR